MRPLRTRERAAASARALGLALLLVAATVAPADWTEHPSDKLERRAAEAIEAFKKRMPKTEPFFADAYGYAILPSVARIGLGVGGAYGKGLVVEQGQIVGRTRFFQFTSGIQAGGKWFRTIVFFRDAEALESFKAAKLQFMGQAGVALATVGANADPGYGSGVAIFGLTRFGVMGEATISGARFTFKPLDAGPVTEVD